MRKFITLAVAIFVGLVSAQTIPTPAAQQAAATQNAAAWGGVVPGYASPAA